DGIRRDLLWRVHRERVLAPAREEGPQQREARAAESRAGHRGTHLDPVRRQSPDRSGEARGLPRPVGPRQGRGHRGRRLPAGGGMSRKAPDAPKAENHERWIVSYADMLTLLFALFVVLYAISDTNPRKVTALQRSLDRAFNVGVLTGDSGSSPIFDAGGGLAPS